VEARLYAEDSAQGFLPATGRLDRLRLPADIRVDTGVREGDTVTPFYDPMIAKLIAQGPSRAEAFARLAAALDRVEAAGCVTNAGFLGRLLRHADVVAGRVDTGLIAREQDALLADPAPDALDWAAAALAALGLDAPGGGGPWQARDGWRAWGRALAVAVLDHGGTHAAVRLTREGAGWRAETPAGAVTLAARREGDGLLLTGEGATRRVAAAHGRGGVTVMRGGLARLFHLPDPLARGTEAEAGGDAVRAPMPGLVKAVHVAPGEAVAAGARLVTLEAMKMEHALRAPRAGTVAAVPVASGDQVEEGALLAALEAE
jgi:3-methylcrotonyl-CoA carboxylase alpha subunit